MISKATIEVQKLFDECGITDPLEIPIETIVSSKNLLLKEEKLDGCEGRIIMKGDSGIITINSNIESIIKKRFAIAHELGHFILHRNKNIVFNDNEEVFLNWYQEKFSKEEIEANEFAAEFLMPTSLFQKECSGKKFGPNIIDSLANRFQVSKTAAILRFVKCGNHPVCVVYCRDNKIKWFKSSEDFKYFLEFQRNAPPPEDSVAFELFTSANKYFGDERKQQIWKSTWLRMRDDEENTKFYEFCLFAKSYNYSLSIIWEN